jgi:hypothetical protein
MLIPIGLYVKPTHPEKKTYIKEISNFDYEYKKKHHKKITKNKRPKIRKTKKYYL